MSDKTLKGIEFEERIASIYRALGYFVERNVNLSGQQVDLTCSRRIDGFGVLKIIVECKYKSSGTVSNQEVQNFVSTAAAIIGKSEIHAAVMITNTEFSRNAKDVARLHPHISLTTARSLEQQLLDDDALLARAIAEYQESDIFRLFVAPSGTGSFPNDNEPGFIGDLDKALFRWAVKATGGTLLVLADFGGGKSTLLRRLNYNVASAVLNGSCRRKPIYAELKHFARHNAIEDLLFASLPPSSARNLTPTQFFQALNSGGFVILLDGFDEIGNARTARERASIMVGFRELIKGESPIVITSRPTYFSSVNEINVLADTLDSFRAATLRALFGRQRLPSRWVDTMVAEAEEARYPLLARQNFGSISIAPFDHRQIEAYLSNNQVALNKVTALAPSAIVAKLRTIYDLEDLMKRPILLSLMVEMILDGSLDINGERLISGASELYEIYTGASFMRDFEKGEIRRLLTSQQCQLFCQTLAIWMLESGVLAIAPSELTELIREKTTELSDPSTSDNVLEKIVTDLRVCSFLRFNEEDGDLRFTHKSFVEFFVAQYLYLSSPPLKERLWGTVLPKEVVYFLGAYCQANRGFYSKLREGQLTREAGAEAEDDFHIRRRNVVAVLISGAQPEDQLTEVDAEIFDMTFSKCKCGELRLLGGTMRQVIAKELLWNEVILDAFELSDCSFAECKINTLRLTGSCTATTFHRTSVERLYLNGRTDLVDFDDCSVSNIEADIDGNLRFSGGVVHRGTIVAARTSQSKLVLDGVDIGLLRYFDASATIGNREIELQPQLLTIKNVVVKKLEIFGIRVQGGVVSRMFNDGTIDAMEGLVIIDEELPSIMIEPVPEDVLKKAALEGKPRPRPVYRKRYLHKGKLLMVAGGNLKLAESGRVLVSTAGLPDGYLNRLREMFEIGGRA